jgi:undecaprenyl-diphosphatase
MRGVSRRARKQIAGFDARVDRAFDRLRGNPASDRLFYGASELGDFSLVWLIIGATRGLRSERDWHAAVRVGGGLAIESVLVNVLIKSLFRRTRPPWDPDRTIRLRRPRTSSFPSGHATSAFSAAGLLSEDDVLWPLYYAIAVIVASSRVYVKVHHASDVLVGAAIGITLGRIGRKLVPLPPAPHIVAEPESAATGRG